jgi:hypothetical protein
LSVLGLVALDWKILGLVNLGSVHSRLVLELVSSRFYYSRIVPLGLAVLGFVLLGLVFLGLVILVLVFLGLVILVLAVLGIVVHT